MSRTPAAPVRAVLVAAAVVVLQAIIVSWFAWPATEIEPRDLPVVVAGPPPAVIAVTEQLNAVRPRAFQVTTVADGTAADQRIRDRKVYAAFIVGADGMSLHVASAASPTVAALLTQASQVLAQQSGRPVTVVDVVPGPAGDPRGAGFASSFLPLVLTSLVAGILIFVLFSGWSVRLIGLAAYTVLAGLGGTAIMHWLGVLDGSYLANAGAVGLLALAVSATIAGLGALLGPAGVGLGVVLVFLFGNPISGIAAAPELLPTPWGAIGQLLPPGAGATLLRSTAFFDGAGSVTPLWTLVGWAAVGLVLVVVGRATAVRGHAPGGQAAAS
jgi:hypothetical protein